MVTGSSAIIDTLSETIHEGAELCVLGVSVQRTHTTNCECTRQIGARATRSQAVGNKRNALRKVSGAIEQRSSADPGGENETHHSG